MKNTKNLSESPILLVDDNPDDMMIAKRAFNKCDIRNKVYETADGEEAMQFLRKEGKYKDLLVLLRKEIPLLEGIRNRYKELDSTIGEELNEARRQAEEQLAVEQKQALAKIIKDKVKGK